MKISGYSKINPLLKIAKDKKEKQESFQLQLMKYQFKGKK